MYSCIHLSVLGPHPLFLLPHCQVSLKSEDYGKHLLGVQDLLQKHSLSEADITTQTDRAKALKVHVCISVLFPGSTSLGGGVSQC